MESESSALSSQEQTKSLLQWQLTGCVKSEKFVGGSTALTADWTSLPPQTPTIDLDDPTSSPSTSTTHTRTPSTVLDLCRLHLRDDLVLRHSVILPGLAEYCGMLCDAALDGNMLLPDLPPEHDYNSHTRDAILDTLNAEIHSSHELREFCKLRETIAAGTAAAFLNQTPASECDLGPLRMNGPWQSTEYVSWREDMLTSNDNSIHAHLHIDRDEIPPLEPFARGLQSAVDFGSTPFLLCYLTEVGYLTAGVRQALQHIGSSKTEFSWDTVVPEADSCVNPLCLQRRAMHGRVSPVGRTAGPDSTIPARIIADIKSLPTSRSNAINFAKARMLLRKVWTKLVSINGTFAIISDGNWEIICMRRRKSRTMFLSRALSVARSASDRTMPSHMKVRVGVNIAATLDVAWRGYLWRTAEQLNITLRQRYKAHHCYGIANLHRQQKLSAHLASNVSSEDLMHHILQIETITLRWPETGSEAERVVDAQNQSSHIAAGLVYPADIDTALEVRLDTEIYPGVTSGRLRAYTSILVPFGDQLVMKRMRVDIVFDDASGAKLIREYQHRIRISEESAPIILPRTLALFKGVTQSMYFLFLEDIGMPLTQYVDYILETRSPSQLHEHLLELSEGLFGSLASLHGTGHTHPGLTTMSGILVAFDHDKSLQLMFDDIHELTSRANEDKELAPSASLCLH
ncbi:hypothetical protein BDZ89DRAFT_1139659 [Hymenopellis radicata]|nr:hypothetical protein BDZ89DRAFT_1139659 [Hymenopellis radicata]